MSSEAGSSVTLRNEVRGTDIIKMGLRHAASHRLHYSALLGSAISLGSVVYTTTQTTMYGKTIMTLSSDDDLSMATQHYTFFLALGSTSITANTLISAFLMSIITRIQFTAKLRLAVFATVIVGLNIALVVMVTRFSEHYAAFAVLLLLMMFFQACIWVFAVVPTARPVSEAE